jgi:hypothetical protein
MADQMRCVIDPLKPIHQLAIPSSADIARFLAMWRAATTQDDPGETRKIATS